jgi:methyltransferase (TIGR00027 family)
MGEWIMVPRTRYGDDFLREHYARGARQLVLLGAGMDARAYRLAGLEELHVFEVDQPTTFNVKEPLLADERLSVASRSVVATDFTDRGRWGRELEAAGLDAAAPTVWLLEGLLMYLSLDDTHELMREVGRLSGPSSAVFHDACSATFVARGNGPVVAGAKFIGGSDHYGELWATLAGFSTAYVRNFASVSVDRENRAVAIDSRYPEATANKCSGKNVVLFVTAEKA